MTKIYLSPDEILRVPGGVSLPPGDSFHILSRSNNGPYRRLCDDQDNFKVRRVGLTAPTRLWCTKCLQSHARRGGTIDRLGNEPLAGFYVVLADSALLRSRVYGDAPRSQSGKLADLFNEHLTVEANRYGFAVQWWPDYDPYPVLLADTPDYWFNWRRLIDLVAEKFNAARAAEARRVELNKQAAEVAERYRRQATFKLW